MYGLLTISGLLENKNALKNDPMVRDFGGFVKSTHKKLINWLHAH